MYGTYPSSLFKAITKSDTALVRYGTGIDGSTINDGIKARAIYVGTAGNVAVKDDEGNTTVIPNVPAGSVLPISPMYIMSTDTTASGFIALF